MLRWFGYILAIIVSVQTLAAVADGHQSHQSDEKYIALQHDQDVAATHHEKLQQKSVTQLPNDSLESTFDCHHHCHSCHSHILIRDNFANKSVTYDLTPIGYVDPEQMGILSLPFRPPRV